MTSMACLECTHLTENTPQVDEIKMEFFDVIFANEFKRQVFLGETQKEYVKIPFLEEKIQS